MSGDRIWDGCPSAGPSIRKNFGPGPRSVRGGPGGKIPGFVATVPRLLGLWWG